MDLLSYILFALALNLDSFGAGVAYGARQIKVPLPSLLIISLISVVAIIISMMCGQVLLAFIPPTLARRFGGILLILIGVWVILQARQAHQTHSEKHRPVQDGENKILKIHIRPLGLVIQVLREPARADLDSSGAISPQEALILGVALAVDAFGAGFAVSILGFSMGFTALVVGLGHFLLTYLGILAGRVITTGRFSRQLTLLPGCILIALGLLKIC